MNDAGFTGERGEPWGARHLVAESLRNQLEYRKSIRQFDVESGADNIFVEAREGYYLANNAIVIYDNVYGGIGLVEDLYQDLPEYALNLSRGAVGASDSFYSETMERFANWLRTHQDSGEGAPPNPGRGNWWLVVKPGSPVTLFSKKRNEMTRGTVAEYTWNEGVRYQVRAEDELIEAADRQLAVAGQGLRLANLAAGDRPETGVANGLRGITKPERRASAWRFRSQISELLALSAFNPVPRRSLR